MKEYCRLKPDGTENLRSLCYFKSFANSVKSGSQHSIPAYQFDDKLRVEDEIWKYHCRGKHVHELNRSTSSEKAGQRRFLVITGKKDEKYSIVLPYRYYYYFIVIFKIKMDQPAYWIYFSPLLIKPPKFESGILELTPSEFRERVLTTRIWFLFLSILLKYFGQIFEI